MKLILFILALLALNAHATTCHVKANLAGAEDKVVTIDSSKPGANACVELDEAKEAAWSRVSKTTLKAEDCDKFWFKKRAKACLDKVIAERDAVVQNTQALVKSKISVCLNARSVSDNPISPMAYVAIDSTGIAWAAHQISQRFTIEGDIDADASLTKFKGDGSDWPDSPKMEPLTFSAAEAGLIDIQMHCSAD